MLKATWMRLGSPAWLAVALVFVVPALAEAQLFPNRTIRREKPDCATEPPFYKQVRRDYFGYYPTCWSRFPAGWGCPCPDPELQMMRDALLKDPADLNRKINNGTTALDEGLAPKDGATDEMNPKDNKPNPDLPATPNNVSPFNIDPTPTIPPPLKPPGRDNLPGTPGASLAPSSNPAMMDMPALPSTSPTAANTPMARPGSLSIYAEDATLTSNTATARPELGPLPSAPTPDPFTPEVGSTSVTMPSTTVGQPMVIGTPSPAQAPKRRSLLGQLFGRNNTNTQNR